MDDQKLKLTSAEITRAFADPATAAKFPPVLDAEQAASLLRIPLATLYDQSSRGKLKGTGRKNGKRLLFWRDRLIERIFNHGFDE